MSCALICTVAAAAQGCGSSSTQNTEPENTTPFGTKDAGSSGGFGATDGGASALPECAEETKDIFVISEEQGLYRFHPPTLQFTSVGLLACPTAGSTPTSMAVDRFGIAWIRYHDGSLWKVSTKDLSCELTKFVSPAEGQPFSKFGMGFSTSSKGGSNEQLFLSDSATGFGIAKLDLTTFKINYVGPFTGDLSGKAAELTGTGDGKLFGFFVTAPAQVAEITKGTGEVASPKPLMNTFAGNAWAFSFYAGDFYVYTSSESTGGVPRGGGGSDVTRYRPSDGSVEVVKPKVGFKIVGAGVSTCAPTEGPK